MEGCRKVQLIDWAVLVEAVQNEQCLFYSTVGNAGRGLCVSSFTLSIHLISLFTVHSFSVCLFLSLFLSLCLSLGCRAYQDLLGKPELQVTLAGRCSEKYKNTLPVPSSILLDSSTKTLQRIHSNNSDTLLSAFLCTFLTHFGFGIKQ